MLMNEPLAIEANPKTPIEPFRVQITVGYFVGMMGKAQKYNGDLFTVILDQGPCPLSYRECEFKRL